MFIVWILLWIPTLALEHNILLSQLRCSIFFYHLIILKYQFCFDAFSRNTSKGYSTDIQKNNSNVKSVGFGMYRLNLFERTIMPLKLPLTPFEIIYHVNLKINNNYEQVCFRHYVMFCHTNDIMFFILWLHTAGFRSLAC